MQQTFWDLGLYLSSEERNRLLVQLQAERGQLTLEDLRMLRAREVAEGKLLEVFWVKDAQGWHWKIRDAKPIEKPVQPPVQVSVLAAVLPRKKRKQRAPVKFSLEAKLHIRARNKRKREMRDIPLYMDIE